MKTLIVITALILVVSSALAEDTAIETEVSAVVRRASAEHTAKINAILVRAKAVNGSPHEKLGALRQKFYNSIMSIRNGPPVSWRFDLSSKAYQSKTIVRLITKCLALESDGKRNLLLEYCNRMKGYLSDPKPAHRAVACEFFARFPWEAADCGAMPLIGALLEDKNSAIAGLTFKITKEERMDTDYHRDRALWQLTVGHLAEFVLRSLIRRYDGPGIPYDRNFSTWWSKNGTKNSVVYWNMRWARRQPEKDFGEIAKLSPGDAVYILAFHGITMPIGGPPGYRRFKHSRLADLQTVADFVRKHSLQPALVDLLLARGYWSGRGLEIAELALQKEHLAKIKKRGATQPSWALALLAGKIDPKGSEQFIAAQARRSGNRRLVAWLAEHAGKRHFDVILKSCAKSTVDPSIVTSLAAAGARPEIAQLFRLTNLTLKPDKVHSTRWSGADDLFKAFVAAAKRLNQDTPVVKPEQVRLAIPIFRHPKAPTSPQQRDQVDRHNRAVPSARAIAVAQLKSFFATK